MSISHDKQKREKKKSIIRQKCFDLCANKLVRSLCAFRIQFMLSLEKGEWWKKREKETNLSKPEKKGDQVNEAGFSAPLNSR